jgi:molybdopterin molybdotransferase
MQGQSAAVPTALPLRAAFDWPQADRRREFMRVRINADGELELFGNQGSGVLTSVVWADGLVDNAPGRTIARGDIVPFLPLNSLLTR